MTPVDGCVCGWCGPKRRALMWAAIRIGLLRAACIAAGVALFVFVLSLAGCARVGGGWDAVGWAVAAVAWLAIAVFVVVPVLLVLAAFVLAAADTVRTALRDWRDK